MIRFFSETSLRRARILSGLIIFAFVFSHLFNHSLALISIDTAERARKWFSLIWLNPVSSLLFYGSVLVHVSLVLRSRSWRSRRHCCWRKPNSGAAASVEGSALSTARRASSTLAKSASATR